MKTLFLSIALVSVYCLSAQEKEITNYNKWSIEGNIGNNLPIKPFSTDYLATQDKVFGVTQFNIGTRYMHTPKFGLKFDFSYDVFKSKKESTYEYKNVQYRLGLQGVVNLAQALKFETFTDRFGLLTHGGVQVAAFIPSTGVNAKRIDKDGGFMLGITPQYRLNNRTVLTSDVTGFYYLRKHFNWDGTSRTSYANLNGIYYNFSIGITYYLGKNDRHIDWNKEKQLKG